MGTKGKRGDTNKMNKADEIVKRMKWDRTGYGGKKTVAEKMKSNKQTKMAKNLRQICYSRRRIVLGMAKVRNLKKMVSNPINLADQTGNNFFLFLT